MQKDMGAYTHAQSCPILCGPMDCRPLSVLVISQARIVEWLPFLLQGNLPDPRIETVSLDSPALAGGFFTTGTTWEAEKGKY